MGCRWRVRGLRLRGIGFVLCLFTHLPSSLFPYSIRLSSPQALCHQTEAHRTYSARFHFGCSRASLELTKGQRCAEIAPRVLRYNQLLPCSSLRLSRL